MSVGPHITVIGPIGAGKSTLVRALASALGALALPERFEDSPYLSRFYEVPERWAFHHTLFFAEQSVSDQYGAQRCGRFAVQERILDEHIWIFGAEFHARAYLTDQDWSLLQRLAQDLRRLLAPVNLLVYLDVDPEEALDRLRHRKRREEQGITLAYLEKLATRYQHFVDSWTQGTVLRLPAADYDFRDPSDVRRVADRVRAVVDVKHEPDSSTRTTWHRKGHAWA